LNLFTLPGAEKYFEALASRYPAASLLDDGKLFHSDGWGNVRKHCLIQAATFEVLGELLGLEPATTTKLASVAICHDWRKRLDKKPTDFTAAELASAESAAQTFFSHGTVDELLFNCLVPQFDIRVLRGEATFLELLQFYVDDLANGCEITHFEERIAEVSARNPNPEPEVARVLVGEFGFSNYWDAERFIGRKIGDMIVSILDARRIPVQGRFDIPKFINAEIRLRIMSMARSDM